MMRNLLFATLFLLGACLPAWAQKIGSPMPWLGQNFFDANEIPLPGGKLCSYAAGTTTPLATYNDRLLSQLNANPLVLGSDGRPQVSVFLNSVAYKFVLRTAGTDATCQTGTVVWTLDNQADSGLLMLTLNNTWTGINTFSGGVVIASGTATFTTMNNRQFCPPSPTAFDVGFSSAYGLLPSTGGIVDCSGLQGAQVIVSDVFTAVAKPVRLLWPSGTASSSVSLTIPIVMELDFGQAGVLSMATSTTATIHATVIAPQTQIFAGAGTVVIQ